ncbi:MAG TPA: type II glyceraldehyde-3-phosphate dehydrogenase [Candidatus Bathyarchaeia archaeon]|nr:type II glyceraldehyde-3-phosphate dehydrogenase [Candidatus Bathyarchaeia archaeon]
MFVNGYGNIGRRLATMLSADKEIQFIGVAKYTADTKTKDALDNQFDIYVPESNLRQFRNSNYKVSGTVEEAVKQSDIIVDAAKEGRGFDNKKRLYEPMKKAAIFQGGEDRCGARSVADMIHNSRVNYAKASGKIYVIQGSCNVSGMGRIMQPLAEEFGDEIERYDVTIVRRWADLEDSKEMRDSIEWDRNPHHQEDVKAFMPTANLYVEAYKVPSRMMHLHQMLIRFKTKAPAKDRVIELLSKQFGVAILNSAIGSADVRRKALTLGFQHGDTNMVHIHQEVMRVQDDVLKILYTDDQTGMVIPENHLLLQSMVFRRPKEEAIKKTDTLFQLSRKKRILEEEFK